jgi:hypothetical protein
MGRQDQSSRQLGLRPGTTPPDGVSERVVLVSPTEKGLFLIRLFVADEKHLQASCAIQRRASCRTAAAVDSLG